jgi:CTD kinase subunit beta
VPVSLLTSSNPEQYFEAPQKIIWGLERLIYEANAFDFRVRKPLSYMVKIAKHLGLPESFVTTTLWATGLDLYRTFIPLKSTTFAMALACIEFAALLENRADEFAAAMANSDMPRYKVTRDEVMGKLLRPFHVSISLTLHRGNARSLRSLH